jgi:hypothetical protein
VEKDSLLDRGRSFVAVRWARIVASCYILPNASIAEFRELRDRLEHLVLAHRGSPIIIAGDFNARSYRWDRYLGARGDLLADWANGADMYLVNQPGVLICVRGQRSSVVDLSWASEAMRLLRGWSIVEDSGIINTDHIPIRITLGGDHARQIQRKEERKRRKVAWNHNKLDVDFLEVALIARTWGRPVNGDLPVEETPWVVSRSA